MSNLICSLLATLILASSLLTSGYGYPDPDKQGNPRTNRAGLQIQNSKLSTARGFGKRDGFIGLPIQHQQQQLQLPSLLSPQSRLFKVEGAFADTRANYPNSWLADEIRNNPELARVVVEKYIDENGELSSDELRRGNSPTY